MMEDIFGLEDHEGLFERTHKEKRIDRILEAATRKRVREAEKATPLRGIKPLVNAANVDLGNLLAKAMAANVKGKKKASVRATAQDTGGRSFHFEAYYASRDEAAREAFIETRRAGSTKLAEWGAANNITPHGTGPGASSAAKSPDAPRTKNTGGRGSSAAHLAYIEREGAVERIDLEREIARELGLEEALDAKAPARGRGRPTKDQQAEQAAQAAARTAALEEIAAVMKERRERALDEPVLETTRAGKEKKAHERVGEREREDARERDPFERDTAGRGKAAAAQAYMENPQKLRNGEISLSSFGTIGETFEERSRFWDLLEEHETVAMARTQNRLIMELPHQATPEARARIMRDFAKTFDDVGLPYHVAIHAPGPQNDDRNFHAHIVWSERPAKRMVDPATNEIEWDFAITTREKDKHRNTRTKHPHRQARNRDVKQKNFIPSLRKHYAECVNAVMKDVDPSVRFDPRSYKDMGITTDPIETVSRITNERLLNGRLIIQDADWTQRMVEAELGKAVLARTKDVAALIDTTKRLEKLKEAWPSVNKINAEVGVFSKMLGVGRFTKATYLQLVNQRLAYENLRLQERVVTRAEATVVRDVLEATSKARREALSPDRQPAFDAEAREAMTAIHEAATEELAGIKERSLRERQRLNGFVLRNKLAWKTTGDMMMPPPSARPIPKFVETPDPKTGKIPFLAGAAAEMPLTPKTPPSSKTAAPKTAAPKTAAPTSASPATAKTESAATPSKTGNSKTTPMPPSGPAPIAAHPSVDKQAAPRPDPASAADPTGMRESQERAKRARESVADSPAEAAKKERAKNAALAKKLMDDTLRRYMELSINTFGGLGGADLGAAVRKFNEDFGKDGVKSTIDQQDLVTFISTGKWPSRPENGPQPQKPDPAAAAAAPSPPDAQPTQAEAPQQPEHAPTAQPDSAPQNGPASITASATEVSSAAAASLTAGTTTEALIPPKAGVGQTATSPKFTTIFDHLVVENAPGHPTPRGGPTPEPTPAAGLADAAGPRPAPIATIFDHLVVEDGSMNPAQRTPPRSRLTPQPTPAATSVPPPDALPLVAIGSTLELRSFAPGHSTRPRPHTRCATSTETVALRILSEGDLEGKVKRSTSDTKGIALSTADQQSGDDEAVPEVDPEETAGEEPHGVEVDEAVAAKRKRAARRAGFVKRGKAGRER